MNELLLIAPEGWTKYSGDQLSNVILTYGDLNNVKQAVGGGDIVIVSLAVDENRYPDPYTAVEGLFVGDDLWIKDVLTSGV